MPPQTTCKTTQHIYAGGHFPGLLRVKALVQIKAHEHADAEAHGVLGAVRHPSSGLGTEPFGPLFEGPGADDVANGPVVHIWKKGIQRGYGLVIAAQFVYEQAVQAVLIVVAVRQG